MEKPRCFNWYITGELSTTNDSKPALTGYTFSKTVPVTKQSMDAITPYTKHLKPLVIGWKRDN